jgi:hypothetical protein
MESIGTNAFVNTDIADLVVLDTLFIILAAEEALAGSLVAVCEAATPDSVGATVSWVVAHTGLADLAG